jgi:hypothetical protein
MAFATNKSEVSLEFSTGEAPKIGNNSPRTGFRIEFGCAAPGTTVLNTYGEKIREPECTDATACSGLGNASWDLSTNTCSCACVGIPPGAQPFDVRNCSLAVHG